MNNHTAANWKSIDEIPNVPDTKKPKSPGKKLVAVSVDSPPPIEGGGSEDEKHGRCATALSALCHGATKEKAAEISGLTVEQVVHIQKAYPIKHLVSNEQHQQDDGKMVGPWVLSRLYQSGFQRYKNDFHSWNCCRALGLTVEQALYALEHWPEFIGILARLKKDHPSTWREYAHKDIERCYRKFGQYKGPSLVRKLVVDGVHKAVKRLGKTIFKRSEIMPLVKFKTRQVQRVLVMTPWLRKIGSAKGTRWEVIDSPPDLKLVDQKEQKPGPQTT